MPLGIQQSWLETFHVATLPVSKVEAKYPLIVNLLERKMAQKLSVNGIHAVKDDIFSLASRIPENAGKAPVGTAHVNTTFNLYKGLSVLALTSFIFNVDTRLQNAGLALLFPGGAFLGLGGILADRVFTDTVYLEISTTA